MSFRESLSKLSRNQLSAVEYVRLIRMGYTDSELEGKSKFFYDAVMDEYNQRNGAYARRGGKVNIWKVPIQPKQIIYLESFGLKITDEDREKVTDAQARDFIGLIQLATENERFIALYRLWERDSTKRGRGKAGDFGRRCTTKDIDEVRQLVIEWRLEADRDSAKSSWR